MLCQLMTSLLLSPRAHSECHAGETMVSGITGEEFAADIFVGPVYYQRLRHMVSDKFQVRCFAHLNAPSGIGVPTEGQMLFDQTDTRDCICHCLVQLLSSLTMCPYSNISGDNAAAQKVHEKPMHSRWRRAARICSKRQNARQIRTIS